MEIPRVPTATSAGPAAPTPPTRSEDPPAAIRPVSTVLPSGSGTDSVEILLFAGRSHATLLRDIRRALVDPTPGRRSEGLKLLRAIAGHPLARQALPDLRQLWEHAAPAERAEVEVCLRAITGRGPEQWAREERRGAEPPPAGLPPHGARRTDEPHLPLLRPAAAPGVPGQPHDPAPGRAADPRSYGPGSTRNSPEPQPLQAWQHWLAHHLLRQPDRIQTLVGGSLLAAALLYLALR